jgi:putative ABC transport system ATP-binding protein
MIIINKLFFKYADNFSLKIDSFNLEKGESVALTGLSGSGKSTFLKLLSGEIQADSGAISILGQDIEGFNDSQRRKFRLSKLGMIFQNSALLEYLNLFENIQLPGRLSGKNVKDKIFENAQYCGIQDLLKRYPPQLSEGEKQRAAICRALVNSPELVFADEPTSSLDPQRSADITDLLTKHCKEKQSSLLMVTHDHSLLSKFDRCVDMSELNGAKNV